jgi:hypothetical protein
MEEEAKRAKRSKKRQKSPFALFASLFAYSSEQTQILHKEVEDGAQYMTGNLRREKDLWRGGR